MVPLAQGLYSTAGVLYRGYSGECLVVGVKKSQIQLGTIR